MEKYDAIIIGSGQGGTPLAGKLAKAGYNTALIERRWIGGTCVNDGCTPTKAMIASAKMASMIRRGAELGVLVSAFKPDLGAIIKRQQQIVESFRSGSEKRLKADKNLTLIDGEASFSGDRKLTIKQKDGSSREITADRLFIDVGTRPSIPKIDGLDKVPYLTSTSILNVTELPEHLLIIGSGYVGLEFGQMYSRFGSKVTIVARAERILKKEDEDIADEVLKIIREEGVDIRLNSEAIRIRQVEDRKIEVVIGQNGKEETVHCSHVLLAAGRTPNSDLLKLEMAGIHTNEKGFINVDSQLQTNVKGIYALGEITGEPAFTHISYNDHIVVYNNLVHHKDQTTDNRLIPYCMFIDPQLARVGINEQEAKARGINFKVAKLPMANVARAIETGETKGLMKAIVDPESKKILGVTVLGAEGGEIMAIVQMAMMGGVTYDVISEAIFAHPTYAESLNNLFGAI